MNAALLAALVLGAQIEITEEMAIRRALELAPELQVEQRDLEIAEAERAGALSLENPQLRVRHNRLAFAPSGTAPLDGAQVHLRWRPPGLDRFGAIQKRDNVRVEIARMRLAERKESLTARVRVLFAELRSFEERRALAEEAVALAERVQALSTKKLEAAVGTRLEDGLARLDVLDALADRAEVEGQLREKRREFRALISYDAAPALQLMPRESRCKAPTEDWVTLASAALESNLDVKIAELVIDEIKAESTRTALDNVPWINFVQLGWIFGDPNDRGQDDPDTLGLRFGMTLPVFNWRTAELRELRSEKARAEARLNQRRRAIKARVVDQSESLRSLAALVALHDKAADEVLKTASSDTERALELGEGNALQLALLRSRLLRARRAGLSAHLDCERAAIKLEALTGRASSPPSAGTQGS